LNRLQSMGLIVAARGTEGGSFVQELDSAFLASSISLMLKMKGVTREELVEARMILAPPIAAFAALRATDEDIHALEEIVSRIDGDRYSDQLHQSLVAFHLRLAAACRNPILQAAMMPLLHLIEPIADLAEIAARDRGLPPKQRHLAPIMNALKSRDPDKARLSMVEYMESFGQRLQSLEIQAPWVGSTPQPGPSK
jgi:GntR family transcriptional repressor for pyruvate dehydrogenase complex